MECKAYEDIEINISEVNFYWKGNLNCMFSISEIISVEEKEGQISLLKISVF